jgi:type II secretory pathway component GspD/PulD (secretin)
MPMIARVVSSFDSPGQEVTEVEIFPLRHADPGEVVDEIFDLFALAAGAGPSEQPARPAGLRFGGAGGLPSAAPAATESSRLKRQATVTAVADRRTQSVIVAAAGNTMAQIKKIIARLDKGHAGVMRVSVFSLGAADAGIVQEAMAVLFSSASSSTRAQAQITTPQAARAAALASSLSTPASATGGVAGTSGGASGLR